MTTLEEEDVQFRQEQPPVALRPGKDQKSSQPGTKLATRWRRRRLLFSTVRLAESRFGPTWRLLALLSFGLILTCMIACTVPLYNLFLIGTQLQHTLETSPAQARNVELRADSAATDTFHTTLDMQARALAAQYLSSFTEPQPFYDVFVQDLTIVHAGPASAAPLEGNTRYVHLEATDFTLAAPHMRLTSGRLPQPPSADGIPEVLITDEMAGREHLQIGDEIGVAQSSAAAKAVTGRIVGIWSPRDGNDPFWNGLSFAALQFRGFPPPPPHYPVFMSYGDLFSSISSFSGLSLTQHWAYLTRPQRITSANMASVATAVQQFEVQVAQHWQFDTPVAIFTASSKLDRLILDTQRQYDFLDVPLYLIAIPMIGLTLLFIASIAIMLVEAESQEIATLKSRGLSIFQLLGRYALQALPPAVLATLVAPALAGFVAALLRRAFQPPETFAQRGITPEYLAGLIQPGTTTVTAAAAALIDDRFAQEVNLKIGDRFTVTFPQAEAPDTHAFSQADFVVVATVRAFPTMYPEDTPLGFIVTNLNDVVTAINQSHELVAHGVNEYWLSTASSPQVQQALANTLTEQSGALSISQVFTRQQAEVSAASNLLNGAMRGVLFTGAAIAAVLALLVTACLVALFIAARYANSLGLGRTLRVGED